MTSKPTTNAATSGPADDALPWHVLPASTVAERWEVDPEHGLDGRLAADRLAEHGSNALVGRAEVPLWRKLLQLFREPLTLVLIAAALVSLVISREFETPLVILLVITVNSVLNLVQERRAQNSLQALQDLSVAETTVRRNGSEERVPAVELVPGDVVLLGAGDAVPADGRLIEAASLEVRESALTGESQPSAKQVDLLPDARAPLGDRTDMLFSATEVTRGRGVLLVTETGMGTEIGRIADMLAGTTTEKTPLQRQIDQLARMLTGGALAVVLVVVLLGLLRGQAVGDLVLTAVSLAVATIPEGLTAVVAFTLAMGASRLARRGAIVKRLSAVETLGSTAHICTDKTGTLTLNQMTAREVRIAGHAITVSGEGYSTDGELAGDVPTAGTDLGRRIEDAWWAMALCNDASVEDGELVGDPTEGALVVLAAKGGLDVPAARRERPRIAEVPFDSRRKFMVTVHPDPDGDPDGDSTEPAARYLVKGAPDVLLPMVTRSGGAAVGDAEREAIGAVVDEMGSRGLRVMAVGQRRVPADRAGRPAEELLDDARDLELLALVGIVDPPRPEAAEAIAVARDAGITVHMITGDHLGTASAIAADLGIPGEAASGSELDDLDDEQLAERAPGYGVLARVAPEHKIRVVRALQGRGEVVAMTGDGVNDAPALQQADIGIAMGITGTDVSKGVATMVLTDDDFATIVAAVEEGRGIYANIVKFVKFQLTTSSSFVLIFLLAGVAGIAGGAPFSALQVLWVNIIMDGPPAMSLGVDPVEPGTMRRPPRPAGEPLLTRSRLLRILFLGAVMAAGTLAVLLLAPGPQPVHAEATVAGTLAFTTFVFSQVFNLLNVRSETRSVFSRQTFANRSVWLAVSATVILQVPVVTWGPLQGLLDTTALSAGQWAVAVAVGSAVLWCEEGRKAVARSVARRALAGTNR